MIAESMDLGFEPLSIREFALACLGESSLQTA